MREHCISLQNNDMSCYATLRNARVKGNFFPINTVQETLRRRFLWLSFREINQGWLSYLWRVLDLWNEDKVIYLDRVETRYRDMKLEDNCPYLSDFQHLSDIFVVLMNPHTTQLGLMGIIRVLPLIIENAPWSSSIGLRFAHGARDLPRRIGRRARGTLARWTLRFIDYLTRQCIPDAKSKKTYTETD